MTTARTEPKSTPSRDAVGIGCDALVSPSFPMQLKQSIESYLACSPKATTRWLNKTCLEMSAPSGANIREGHDDVLCAVIPFATRKQAAATVKWANLTEEQKVERLAKALSRTHGRLFGSPEDWKKQLEQKRIAWRNYAAACIRAMEEAT